jgi:hypothetical protein
MTPVAFQTWLKAKPADEQIVVAAVEDPARSDVVFVASAQAIADACRQSDDTEFFGLATALATTLLYLIEAILVGLVIEQGFDRRGFWRLMLRAR